ncbi:MAG: metallophosphoesterase family protein [Phototrophicaceae bacterium]
MQYAVIFGDIHGNLPALEAVFIDMSARGYDANRYCLGDLVGYGTFPNEVIDLIRGHKIPSIMGNYDQGVGNNSDDCGCAYKTDHAKKLGEQSIAWSNAHVTDDNKAYLRNLPPHHTITIGKSDILLVHGSPRKVNEYLYEDRSDASLMRIMDGIDASVMICGHTHLPYDRTLPDGRRIINAGSVGKPKDNNRDACYIVVKASDNTISVEFIRVPYDVEHAARAIEATTMPNEFAQMLRDGRG